MSIRSLGHVFCLPHCSFAAAAGYGTQKDTLTVSFHTILPSVIFGWAGSLTVKNTGSAIAPPVQVVL